MSTRQGEPAVPGAGPKRALGQRLHGHLPQANRLWEDFDSFVLEKRGYDEFGAPIPAEKSNFSMRSEDTYADALNLAIGLLDRAGEIDRSGSPRLADVCNPDTIARAANLWQTRAR